jgi:MFS family permease
MSFKDNIWKAYLFKFFLSLHFIGGILVPFFVDWGGISFTQLMLLESLFVFSIFLLEVPTGAVADHFGRKTSLIVSAIFVMMGVITFSLYPNIYFFMLGEVLWAASVALLSGADQALVYDSLKEIKEEKQSKKVFGRLGSFHLAGIMVGAPIGSIIASIWGLQYAVRAMVIPFFLAFLIAFSFKEPKTKKKVESQRYIKVLFSGVNYFKSHKVLKILAFDRISIYVLSFFIVWTYQPLLQQQNFPLFYFGFVHAGIALAEIFFMNSFGFMEKTFGSKKKYLLISSLIPGICFIILGFNNIISITILLIIILGAFGLTRQELFNHYMHKHIESHNRATVMSSVSMLERFALGIMYPLVGLSVEWSLSYTFVALGILVLLSTLVSRVEEGHLLD